MNVLTLLPKRARRSARPIKPKAAPKPKPAAPLPPIPLPQDLKRKLIALRRRDWTVAAGTGFFMLLGVVSILFLAQSLVDWWFDLPWLARAVFLLIDLILLGSIYRHHFHRPGTSKPGLARTALLVEKEWPRLQQSVITAVEMAEGTSNATRGSRQLVDILMEQARARTTDLDFKEVVPTRALRRWIILGSVAVMGVGVLAAVTWPSSLTQLERILLFDVPLPTKTIVVPISHNLTIPVGSDVEISARAQGVIPTHGRVVITYDGAAPQEFSMTSAADKPSVFTLSIRNVQKRFTYQFQLNDGHGLEYSVVAKVPPAITGIECTEVFPDYTKLPSRKVPLTALSLMAGSHLKVEADATEALKSAKVVLQGVPQPVEMTLDSGKTHLTADVPIPAKNATGLSLHLIDETGVSSANETVYPIQIIPDHPPTVTIVEPEEQCETLTVQAKPVIAFDASDDFGLTKLTLTFECIPPPVNGFDTPALPQQHIPFKIKPASEGTRYEYVVNVSAQVPRWQEGWSVNYWVEAVDNNTVTGPGITRTEHQQFGVLSSEAKQAEILARLKKDAADINSLSDIQQKVSQDVQKAIPQK